MYIILFIYYNNDLIYIIKIILYFIYQLFEMKYIDLHTIILIDIINNILQAKLKLIIFILFYFILLFIYKK